MKNESYDQRDIELIQNLQERFPKASAKELAEMVKTTYDTLKILDKKTEKFVPTGHQPGLADVTVKINAQEAIADPDKRICMFCGKEVKTLTTQHLKTHNHTSETYAKLFGYDIDDLTIPSILEKKRARMKELQKLRTKKK